jgi:pimeloyl-ACP methyl ester carboxylesterase
MRVDARGLTFDVHIDGPDGGDPVLLLHGFPQDSREWAAVRPKLHAAGLRTYALDQRGYSPGARPPAVADYLMAECVADAVAVLDALGIGAAHVVGHDWGASVAWQLAARHGDRVRTLTAVSIPHPLAMAEVTRRRWSQRARLAYMLFFRSRLAEPVLLARGGAVLRALLRPAGPDRAAGYATAMREPGRLTATLNWYRALSGRDLAGLGPVDVPTTYVWSDGDSVVSREAAERAGAFVTADYRLVALPGISHWIPEQAPAALADAVLARIAPGAAGGV